MKILEIEVDEILITYSLIPETGIKDWNQVWFEMYVSWKLTLFGVLQTICSKLAVDYQWARMWKGESLIDKFLLSETIEERFWSTQLDIYIEIQFEDDSWPTDWKEIIKVMKKEKNI